MLRLHEAVEMTKHAFIFNFRARADRVSSMFFGSFLVFLLFTQCFAQDEDDDKSAEAVAFFNQGQNSHEKGELTASILLYDKALSILPQFPEAELQRGNALVSLGRLDDAEKSFRRAVEYRGDWTLALANLGSVLVGSGKNAEAEQFLLKAIALDNLNFPAYSALAELRLNTKAKPDILRDLLSKIKILTEKARPTASIWAARGALENSLGDRKSAKSSFEKALELDPKNQYALTEKGGADLDESDITSAEGIVQKLEAIAPDSSNVKMLRARVLFARGKHEDALKMLDSIVNPSADVLTIRDKILISSTADAAELEKHLEKSPLDLVILARLCSILRVENPSKALDYCRRASKADPSSINHAIGYGAALVQAKLYAEAITLFRRLLIIAPENSTIHANLATALFQSKRYPEAKSEYQWIVEKQPALSAAYYFLAITHDHLGEYIDAMANYQQFLRVADGDKNKLEIEKVNLRLPGLQKQIKKGKGKKDGQ